ncbi:MAG: threonine synthase [Zetaproteobacteria bacterium]|nr:MAG: threonine synthase [Zetaproteobacteria bacterium]
MRPLPLVISQALLSDADGVRLHPDLASWQAEWLRMRRRWFRCAPMLPLSCYARLLDCSPAALIAARTQLPAETRQVWVASPYFAALGRDSLTVLPEGAFSWDEQDARWLCDELNPLLEQDGMRLVAVGAAMLLCCVRPLDARPADFAEISGGLLPNRHPPGRDGGRLMRLVAEIQMLLHRHPSPRRRARGVPDVHGLWFWGGCAPTSVEEEMAVATRNPALASIAPARQARCLISEAERVHDLMPSVRPAHIVLLGKDMALWLSRGWLPRVLQRDWRPSATPGDEDQLFAQLRGMIA